MLKCMCRHTRIHRIMNHELRERFGVAPLSIKLRENMRWFSHMYRKTGDALVSMVESLIVEGMRSQGRSNRTWERKLKTDL